MDHLLKTKKEYKSLKNQETQDIFININWTTAAFRLIWLMDNLKICPKKTTSVLRGKEFDIAKNQNFNGYQTGLVSMVYKNFDKKFATCANNSAATHKGTGINLI